MRNNTLKKVPIYHWGPYPAPLDMPMILLNFWLNDNFPIQKASRAAREKCWFHHYNFSLNECDFESEITFVIQLHIGQPSSSKFSKYIKQYFGLPWKYNSLQYRDYFLPTQGRILLLFQLVRGKDNFIVVNIMFK